jgi:hypothetical protein
VSLVPFSSVYGGILASWCLSAPIVLSSWATVLLAVAFSAAFRFRYDRIPVTILWHPWGLVFCGFPEQLLHFHGADFYRFGQLLLRTFRVQLRTTLFSTDLWRSGGSLWVFLPLCL